MIPGRSLSGLGSRYTIQSLDVGDGHDGLFLDGVGLLRQANRLRFCAGIDGAGGCSHAG